jgi:hypothetical protein
LDDYVAVVADDQTFLVHKKALADYRPQFKLQNVNDRSLRSSWQGLFGSAYETDLNYFAKKLRGALPEDVFHCVNNYCHPGFCKYVQTLPGFDNFILSMGDQLKPGSALWHKMSDTIANENAFLELRRQYGVKMREKAHLAKQVKRQKQQQTLRALDFNERGLKLLEKNDLFEQFIYTGNLQQNKQRQRIVQHLNQVGEFRAEHERAVDLLEIVDYATDFGISANCANRDNLHAISQTCLEISTSSGRGGRWCTQSKSPWQYGTSPDRYRARYWYAGRSNWSKPW